jgi:hypothetical protein
MGPDSIPVLDLIIAFLLISMLTVTYSAPQELSTKHAVFQKYYEQFIFRQTFLSSNASYCMNSSTISLGEKYLIKIVNGTFEKIGITLSNETNADLKMPVLFLSCGDTNVKIYKNK